MEYSNNQVELKHIVIFFERVLRAIQKLFFSVGVMYSGGYDVCDVILSVYPVIHTGQSIGLVFQRS